jgi:hypothetical protein
MFKTSFLLLATSTFGQTPFWPGAQYDPAVPTHKQVLGYDAGARISSPAGIVQYMEALAKAAPARIKVWDYAKTWEGRRLIYAAVGSDSNIRRLPEIQAAMKKLADPRVTTAEEAARISASLPVVIWLGYGVHGNEISSPDAALLTAYHLLAARKDPIVDAILANVVVLIDPLQNPDGRDRFVRHFERSEGLEPDPNPAALEHTEPWPNGRTNHYHFDMNRDWFALTQPETRGRVKALQEWFPLVFVDLHEMGADSTYYFAPEAVPYNPHLTRPQTDSLEWFGRNNAKWFDKYGFSYFTREVYDAFYPGYGASWPSYYGSIAMTYEQASARGLKMRRSDGSVFEFRDTVRQHFVASISTAEAAATNRRRLLDQFYQYRQTAIEEGRTEPVREFILARKGNVSAVDKLAVVLADQGVEVHRSAAALTNDGKEYPAGSYVIKLAQPAKRLVRTLLDKDVPMSKSFVEEQERRRSKNLPDEIYDVTAWSLPLLYGVEAIASGQASPGKFELVKPGSSIPGAVKGGKASVAYLVPWGTSAAGRMLAAALRQELKVWSTDKSFTQLGTVFPAGTLIFKVQQNPESLHEEIGKLAASTGADVVATNTGWVEDGVNFGSRYVSAVRKPTIAMAWDQPVAASAGHTRFVLERQFGYPVTPVRTSILPSADLTRFDVLILPDGNYAGAPWAKLKDWVTAGGVVIAIKGAIDPKSGLFDTRQENLPKDTKEEAKPSTETRVPGKLLASEADYVKAIQPEGAPDDIAGVLATARLDPDHWLAAGAGDRVHALLSGNAIFTPLKLDKGVNAAVFAGPEELLASGYLWRENRLLLAHKPLAMAQRHGRGYAIGFTADPNFRAYMDGMNILFLNAVFRGPSHAGRGAGVQ